MPTDKEVLHGLLSTALQMDEAGVASLYNEDESLKDDAMQVILDKHAEKIKSLKPDTKEIFDNGYKKGQLESLSKFERDILETTGLKSEKKGLELIKDLVSQYAKEHPDDPDKIKKSKIYIDAVESFNKEKADMETNYKNQLSSYQKTVEREKVFNVVAERGLLKLDEMRPVPLSEPAKTANLRKVFLNELGSYNWEIRGEDIVALDNEGNDLTDGHGNRIKYDTIVSQAANKYFDFYQADDKQAPNHKQTNTKNPTVFIVSSEADFINQMKTATAETRPLILDAYNKAREAGKF